MRFTPTDMQVVRRAHAMQLMFMSGQNSAPVEDAFATVEKELFVPKPWIISGPYRASFIQQNSMRHEDPDPAVLYQDRTFVLRRDKNINVGSPSLHAELLSTLDVQKGHSVAHIGCGTGYYSAILAQLVGPDGHVFAVEFDAELASFTQSALAGYQNVEVVTGNGWHYPTKLVDRIYVNFATSEIAPTWIANLRVGGKLIFPLGELPPNGDHASRSGMFEICNDGSNFYPARFLMIAIFVHGEAIQEAQNTGALNSALNRKEVFQVSRFIWQETVSTDKCWYQGHSWALC